MKKTQKVLSLRPTQFAVGMLEVDQKIKELSAMTGKRRRATIKETAVPVVRGPEGALYVVDRHHFLCVCYHLDIERVRVEVVADHRTSSMSYSDFWRWMNETRNAYPYCQFGEGPRKELYLPKDVRGLADDPYRSLAWFVRKAGAFENSEKNFAEFTWANFFRSKGLLDEHGLAGLEQACVRAVAIAQSKEAEGLPGYDKLNLSEQAEVKAEARKRARDALEAVVV